jgi:polyhydroxyalkanoate synthesis regulator phasin
MVLTDGDQVGLKGVRYGQLTPVLVEAIKEMKADYENKIETQERKIESQETKIETQEQRIEKLERMVEQLLNAKGE